ncbi:cation:proton antiporter [Crocinitomix catalasitica]|nr:cation:proton antiporter [Crocinitomix catalasitica]
MCPFRNINNEKNNLDTYLLIIGISSVIIISFFFNILAKRTNIPSVLMLIGLGVILKEFVPESYEIGSIADLSTLEIIGNVGLVMIVLEAALDLNLSIEKKSLIINSFLVALVALVLSSFVIASLIYVIVPGAQENFYNCLVYAVPLSIMSSAIIIPSVGGLTGLKKDFMVYESTFSDILGIMFFYFLIGTEEGASFQTVATDVLINILVTVLVSIILAYLMVFIFQRLTSQVKLFLVIAVLMFMYAMGKKFHLSSLLIILAFGVVLNNTKLFFRGEKLSKWVNEEKVKPILRDFQILTLESAFVIRTFFFVIFGLFITLNSITNIDVALVSLGIILSLYLVRYLVLKAIIKTDISPQLYIAPRGLITILLFFVIGARPEFAIEGFDAGILLFVILITSIVMTVSLILYRGEKVRDVLLSQLPKLKIDRDKDGQHDDYEDNVEDNVDKQDFNQF